MAKDSKQRSDIAGNVDRRAFIGAAAATAGMMFIKPQLVRGTAANSAVRIGLLGCGGGGAGGGAPLLGNRRGRGGGPPPQCFDHRPTERARILTNCSNRRATPSWTLRSFSLVQSPTSNSRLPRKWTR